MTRLSRPHPGLKAAVTGLEDGIITLSGPTLAISGIIAGVDLVTGGNMLRNVGWLSTVWAVTLLLTLDFQVLALGARTHQVYRSDTSARRKIVEIALAVLIAAAISYVSIQMQSVIARANSENISIDLATAQLGINPIALIWERSTLVLVLIFMSGWFRDDDSARAIPAPPPQPPVPPDLNPLLERLDTLYQQRFESVIQQVKITMEQTARARPDLPALPLLEDHASMQEAEQGERAQGPGSVHPTPALDRGRVQGERGEDFGDAVEAVYRQYPDLSMREVAARVGCSKATVSKWKKRLHPGGAAPHHSQGGEEDA